MAGKVADFFARSLRSVRFAEFLALGGWLLPIAILVILVFGAVMYWVPARLVPAEIDDATARFNALNDSRRLVAQVLGAILLLLVGVLSLFWTARRSLALEDQVRIARAGQVTERISRAIEHIGSSTPEGSPNKVVRAGGLGSLGRIAVESDDDRQAIIAMFAEYLRSALAIGWPVTEDFYTEYESQGLRWEWLRERQGSLAPVLGRIDVAAAISQLERNVKVAVSKVPCASIRFSFPTSALPSLSPLRSGLRRSSR